MKLQTLYFLPLALCLASPHSLYASDTENEENSKTAKGNPFDKDDDAVINVADNILYHSPEYELLQIAEQGTADNLKVLLTQNPEVQFNTMGKYGTVLMTAVWRSNLEVVKLLKQEMYQNLIGVNQTRKDGHTALTLAVLMRIFLDQEDLHARLRKENKEIFQDINQIKSLEGLEEIKAKQNIDPNNEDWIRKSMISLKVISNLLKYPRINIDKAGRGGWSALEMAMLVGDEDLIYVLRKNGAKYDTVINGKKFTAKDLDKFGCIPRVESRITRERVESRITRERTIKRVGVAGGVLAVCALAYYAFIGRKEEKKPPKTKPIKAK